MIARHELDSSQEDILDWINMHGEELINELLNHRNSKEYYRIHGFMPIGYM